ncbi:MAG: hypothetical protein KDD64_10925 [Bdellovibrionales bacterium]|nr:hypothetical protein [Bdellovibrionales bacterium]
MGMSLYLIDAIGPFFLDYERRNINWSKIPFENLEKAGSFDQEKFERIVPLFRQFVTKARQLGFNAVTLDDLAHLVQDSSYKKSLQEKISQYRAAYRKLFTIARESGLAVFITSDVMFFSESLYEELGENVGRCTSFLRTACDQTFEDFPEISGVIFRIGEADGVDVHTDFPSRLVLKTAKGTRRFLESLLPVFERKDKKLIFRTWSVGINPVGDLNWNRDTFAEVFDGLHSPSLIISMKYGESDFFRFLPLNKLFFYSKHQKIIEFQARREYEGFGEYPSFVGWEYQSYVMQLKTARNVVGCSVWCQTGGWSHFRKLTFLPGSSIWNELNTFVTINIFRKNWSAEQAIEAFYNERFSSGEWRQLVELLRLSDEAIRELIYIDDFSNRKMFFRRLRVPPVLWVYWDTIIVNHLMRKLLRVYVEDAEQVVAQGRLALLKIRKMRALADAIGIEENGILFQLATFQLLCAAREYYLLPFSQRRTEKLKRLKTAYEHQFPEGYEVELDFRPFSVSSKILGRMLSVLLRDKRGYRFLDRIFTIRMLRFLYPLVRWWEKKWLPPLVRQRAMGLESIFK